MKKQFTLLFALLFVMGLFITQPATASSNEPLSNDKVFEFLEEAFQAQSSLTFEFRSYEEVEKILSPYFEKQYIDVFLKENLIKENNKYIIYGSDFALYFIPFFSYSEKTRVVKDELNNNIYVYELFESPTSGPVSYNDHYEIITLKESGTTLKVSDLKSTNELPIEIKGIDESEEDATNSKSKTVSPWKKLLIWNPFKTTLYSLIEMETRTPITADRFKWIF
ncbi:DUF3993 domain-containing protein [Fredinandcohnia sp. 179-A 10B2 NHS]|uniref:DUF3993 domain-containing protein n=1 Tax=Fredinandcohnia sp. 179-A 10B2 NHS TaxID=3235176 RepID=UPI0039A2E419